MTGGRRRSNKSGKKGPREYTFSIGANGKSSSPVATLNIIRATFIDIAVVDVRAGLIGANARAHANCGGQSISFLGRILAWSTGTNRTIVEKIQFGPRRRMPR